MRPARAAAERALKVTGGGATRGGGRRDYFTGGRGSHCSQVKHTHTQALRTKPALCDI